MHFSKKVNSILLCLCFSVFKINSFTALASTFRILCLVGFKANASSGFRVLDRWRFLFFLAINCRKFVDSIFVQCVLSHDQIIASNNYHSCIFRGVYRCWGLQGSLDSTSGRQHFYRDSYFEIKFNKVKLYIIELNAKYCFSIDNLKYSWLGFCH